MRTSLIIAGLLLLLLFAGYYIFTKTAEPSAIELFMPAKLHTIPIGENRTVVYDYLGTPQQTRGNEAKWIFPLNDNKRYVLAGFFRDSILAKYTLTYEVDLFGYTRERLLKADTLR